ncbi:glycosyltransferase [bacterium]|nr:MAG: glycosyltransferase [bacterium]
MDKKSKIFVVASYNAAYILRDIELLRKYYYVKVIGCNDNHKNVINIFRTIIEITKGVCWSDVSYIWFADFRAFVTILFAKIVRKRTTLVVGGYEVAHVPEFSYGGYLGIVRTLRLKFILLNADRIIASSKYLQKEIKKLIPHLDVIKIELGIDAQENKIVKKPIIITVGSALENIYKLKGLDIFAQCSIRFHSYRFVIIGKYDKKIENKILRINPKIIFTGQLKQNKVFEWMNKSIVYCQLSYVESFGVALLEAMSFGCVPVVTNRGAMPEIVGDTGFYTEFGNVEITIKAIEKALKSKKSSESQKRATYKFPSIKRESKLQNLIENIIWN